MYTDFALVYDRLMSDVPYQEWARYYAGLLELYSVRPKARCVECACGTGAISEPVAQKCKLLIATDMAEGMLRQTYKKCSKYGNVKVRRADLTQLKCKDNRFDKVVAGNVIHLLNDPEAALRELLRVCKPGGKVIIPTYINNEGTKQRAVVKMLEKMGASFKRQFDLATYKQFFADAGFPDAEFSVVEGRMPCAIAVIQKP